MTLAALIRKRESGKVATAIPAISATQPREAAATVARIATVAVATPTETETATASIPIPIPGDLERLIQRAATYWEYSPDDLAVIHQAAQRDPEGLRLALENDVAFVRQKESAPAITGRDQA